MSYPHVAPVLTWRAQMFAQGTQRFPQAPGTQAAAAPPPSPNGTLDEPVSDTLKRDLLRCAARPRRVSGATRADVDAAPTRSVARNVRAVLLPGLKGTAGVEVRHTAARRPAAQCALPGGVLRPHGT